MIFIVFFMHFSFLIVYLNLVMKDLLKHIKPGMVYRRSDLEFYSTAIDRHLAQLTNEGHLIKLSHGMYFSPIKSKFGMVPPDDRLLVECFLKDDYFLMLSPNIYNTLGLGLTQLYNTTWVYNHKRKGQYLLNGKVFEFKQKSAFPDVITREFLLVDLLNNFGELAEDYESTMENLFQTKSSFDEVALMQLSQKYGNGKTKQLVKSLVRQLNING
jgi:hypothetical protein